MRDTFNRRVEVLFRSRPGEWIDGRELAAVGGAYGWRTRVSDVRRSGLNITNRVRRVKTPTGEFVVSEYKYQPPTPTDLLQIAESGETTC